MGTSDVPASHPVGNWTGSTKTQPQLNDKPWLVAISRSLSQNGCDFSTEVKRLTDLGCHRRELHPSTPSWSDCKMPCMRVYIYIYTHKWSCPCESMLSASSKGEFVSSDYYLAFIFGVKTCGPHFVPTSSTDFTTKNEATWADNKGSRLYPSLSHYAWCINNQTI